MFEIGGVSSKMYWDWRSRCHMVIISAVAPEPVGPAWIPALVTNLTFHKSNDGWFTVPVILSHFEFISFIFQNSGQLLWCALKGNPINSRHVTQFSRHLLLSLGLAQQVSTSHLAQTTRRCPRQSSSDCGLSAFARSDWRWRRRIHHQQLSRRRRRRMRQLWANYSPSTASTCPRPTRPAPAPPTPRGSVGRQLSQQRMRPKSPPYPPPGYGGASASSAAASVPPEPAPHAANVTQPQPAPVPGAPVPPVRHSLVVPLPVSVTDTRGNMLALPANVDPVMYLGLAVLLCFCLSCLCIILAASSLRHEILHDYKVHDLVKRSFYRMQDFGEDGPCWQWKQLLLGYMHIDMVHREL